MKPLLALAAALAVALIGLGAFTTLLAASAPASACQTAAAIPPRNSQSGGWVATAYGPPWGGIEGNGTTATGLDLTAGPPAYEIAVDPRVIPLGSWVYVQPNPFNTTHAFYAGDTGGAISGHHIDIYDWEGRASQNTWGTRRVTVTPARTPTGANPLDASAAAGEACATSANTPAESARILPDGTAVAPADAPTAVKLAIAAGNLIHTRPYPEPDVHYGSLARLWPAYDCSGATSFLLYAAGLLGPNALDSTELESYGQPGPGRWITIYANPTHAWIVVAGIALDTADYGGPAIPAGTGPRWRTEPLANLRDGGEYAVRHPPEL